MAGSELPKEFRECLAKVKARRAKAVIEHILQNGFITTEELRTQYGYGHPPRAARDVREQGIPLETFTVKGSDNRSIAAYRFGDPAKLRPSKLGGRRALTRELKAALVAATGPRCGLCLGTYEPRGLQVDHRIPYEVAGDPSSVARRPEDYMLLCRPCNRAKSWSCEHCPNWLEAKKPAICGSCYWAFPANYKHIALRVERRLDLLWSDDEVEVYERLRRRSLAAKQELPAFVKQVLARHQYNNGEQLEDRVK